MGLFKQRHRASCKLWTSWVIGVVLGVVMATRSVTAAEIDIAGLQKVIAESGVTTTVDRLRNEQPNALTLQLAAALGHVASFVEQDASQLWFQLQARTRLVGWEGFQEQLLKQSPPETLVALTSELDPARSGVLRTWNLGDSSLSHLALSTDGTQIYCGTLGGDLIILDAKTFQIVRRMDQVGRILATGHGSSGDLFIAHGYGRKGVNPRVGARATAYEVETGERIAELGGVEPASGYVGFASSPFVTVPDGSRIIQSVRDAAFIDWPLDGSPKQKPFRGGGDTTFCDTIFMQFINSGKQLVTGDNRGHLRVFDWPERKEAQPSQLIGGNVTDYSLSPDASLVAVTSAYVKNGGKDRFGTLVIWDRLSGRPLTKQSLPTEPPLCTTFTADGQSVLTGGFKGTVSRWNHAAEPVESMAVHSESIVRILTMPDGKHVVTGDRMGMIKVFNLDDTIEPTIPLPRPTAIIRRAISPDGTWEADFSTRKLNIRDSRSGKLLHVIRIAGDLAEQLGDLKSAALDPARQRVILGGLNAIVHWDLPTGAQRVVTVEPKLSGPPSRKRSRRNDAKKWPIRISPDGNHAVVWQGTTLTAFEPESGAERFSLKYEVRRLSEEYVFLPGDRLAIPCSAISDQGVRSEEVLVIDLRTGDVADRIVHGAYRDGFAYARGSGNLAISGQLKHGEKLRGATIWNAQTREQQVLTFNEPFQRVIGITDDGTRLLTLDSRPTVIRIWDLATQTVIRQFHLGVKIGSASFDGRTLMLKDVADKTHMFEYRQ